MSRLFFVVVLFVSFSSYASDYCRLRRVNSFHPDGTPNSRISVFCSNRSFQKHIFLKYNDYRLGETDLFQSHIRKSIVNELKLFGYIEVKNGFYESFR